MELAPAARHHSTVDIPRHFVIRERDHRIHNPFSEAKLATLGRALRLPADTRVLDLCCGSGEMLCTWARDLGMSGVGVDLSPDFLAVAHARAAELGVADRVSFVHGDAAGHVADEPVDLVCCLGATWIGDGMEGTVELMRRSLRPGGMMLVGEPYWRHEPPDQETVEGSHARDRADFTPLPELLERFGATGCDVVEMVLADQDSWDRYVAPQWLSIRRWLDANPDDELHDQMRAELDTAAIKHVRYAREYLGWGVFALMNRP